jgi:hypothetical protein
MKQLFSCGCLLSICLLCSAFTDREEDPAPEEGLLTGRWILQEVHGGGNWTSTGGSGNRGGGFAFFSVDSTDAWLEFNPYPDTPPHAVDGGVLYGDMIYDPDPSDFSTYGKVYDAGIMPSGLYVRTGDRIVFTNFFREAEWLIDELTEETFVLTTRFIFEWDKSNRGKTSDRITTDGLYTFYYIR